MKRTLILFFTVFLIGNAYGDDSKNYDSILAESIGKIILYEDQCERYYKIGINPYSAEKHMQMIENEYEIIKSKLPRDKQIDFLWTVMVRSGFGCHYSERFSEMLFKCCYKEFMLEIDKYLKHGLKHDSGVLNKVRIIKGTLEFLSKVHNK